MIPLLVSVVAGGVVVGLLVRAIGLLVVRSAMPQPARRRPARRYMALVEDARRGQPERRSVA